MNVYIEEMFFVQETLVGTKEIAQKVYFVNVLTSVILGFFFIQMIECN